MKIVKVFICITLGVLSQLTATFAGSCYANIDSDGNCSQLRANDVTREECCSTRLGVAYDEAALSDVSIFMISAGIKKQKTCKPCQESCESTKCGVGKRCIMKRGKPKCVCAPSCKASAMKKSSENFSVIRLPQTKNIKRQQKTYEMQNDEPTLIVANIDNTRNANQRVKFQNNSKTSPRRNETTHDDEASRLFAMKFRSGYFDQQSTKVISGNDDFYIGVLPKFSHYSPVCSSDGRTYKNECQLRKRACRQENESLNVAYKGHCQHSCQFIKCTNGKTCIEDQNAHPQCIKCPKCSMKNKNLTKESVAKMICGMDGITYRNMCELRQKSCKIGKMIPVLHQGPCTEALGCSQCSKSQKCLPDLMTHQPKCVTCSNKCPRKNRQTTGKQQRREKICGRNGITYNSYCHMIRDSCNTGYFVDVQHQGPCQS